MTAAFRTAQMWARNTSGDQAWSDHVTTLDEDVLHHLAAVLKVEQRAIAKRRAFVEVMLELSAQHECDCDKRWTTNDAVPHDFSCDRLNACTCELLWTGGGLHILDHHRDCDLRRWTMKTPGVFPPPEPGDIAQQQHE